MNIKELKEKLSKIDLLSTYPFINGYGISTKTDKISGNDYLVVNFNVPAKIQKDNIKENYILPKNLSAFGIDIETKVTESYTPHINHEYNIDEKLNYYNTVYDNTAAVEDDLGYITFLNHYDQIALQNSLSSNIDPIIGTSFENFVPFFHSDNESTMPVSANNMRMRPLSSGSRAIYNTNGFRGTMGLIVRDRQDRSLVGLSNSHVFARTLLIGEEALAGETNNMLFTSARQPAAGVPSSTTIEGDHIGNLKRSSLISVNNDNITRTDAAICDLSTFNVPGYEGEDLLQSSSNRVMWFKERGPYEFASSEEIDSLMDPSNINYQSPIFRSGGRAGPLGYPGSLVEIIRGRPQSSFYKPVNLSNTLTSVDGVNLLTEGLCSFQVNANMAPYNPHRACMLFLNSDRDTVYIKGRKWSFDYNSINEPFSFWNRNKPTFENVSLDENTIEIAMTASNHKIKAYGVAGHKLDNSYYYDDNNDLYIAGQVFDERLFNHGSDDARYGVPNTNYTDSPYLSPFYYDAPQRKTITPYSKIDFHHRTADINGPGIRRMYFDNFRWIILTENNKLYIQGRNFIDESMFFSGFENRYTNNTFMGTGVSGSYSVTFREVPGEYSDFITGASVANNSNWVLAISADERTLCTSYLIMNENFEQGSFTLSDGQPWWFERGAVNQADWLQFDLPKPDFVLTDRSGGQFPNGVWISGGMELSDHTFKVNINTTQGQGNYPNVDTGVNDGPTTEFTIKKFITPNMFWGGMPQPGIDTTYRTPFAITSDNQLMRFTGTFNQLLHKKRSGNAELVKDVNGNVFIWNDECKLIDMDNYSLNSRGTTHGILSGSDLYVVGKDQTTVSWLDDPRLEMLTNRSFGKHTNYPLSALYTSRDLFFRRDNPVDTHYGTPVTSDLFVKYTNFPSITGGKIAGCLNYVDSYNPNGYLSLFLIYSNSEGMSAMGDNPNYILSDDSLMFRDDLVCIEIDYRAPVNMGSTGSTMFNDTIRIQSKDKLFASGAGGDSGSSVWAYLSSTDPTTAAWKCIGLLFAGTPESVSNYNIVCRIDNIQDELDIEPWEGNIEE